MPIADGIVSCRVCGCTNDNACILPGPALTCGWHNVGAGNGTFGPDDCYDDICTACLPDARAGWVHPSAKAIETDLEIAALLGGPPASGHGSMWATATESAGGELTREDLERAAEAIRDQPARPTTIVTSPRTVARGRWAAHQAEAAATYAEDELARLPRWRWLRRRYLRRRIAERSRFAQSLRATFGFEGRRAGEGD